MEYKSNPPSKKLKSDRSHHPPPVDLKDGCPRLEFNPKSTVSNPVRQRCLEKIYVTIREHYPEYNQQKAAEESLREEAEVYHHCSSRDVYLSEVMGTVSRIKRRKEIEEEEERKRIEIENQILPNGIEWGSLYSICHSVNELSENDYPLMSFIEKIEKKPLESRQVCARCGDYFELINEEICRYHSGRTINESQTKQKVYTCCQGTLDSTGCSTGRHVFELKALKDLAAAQFVDFKETKPCPLHIIIPENKRMIAVDCEMAYTLGGMELIRLSMLDSSGKVLVDELVKPNFEILDLNTRFSGVNQKDMEKSNILSFEQAQALFLDVVYRETILVGHSLESDLKTLRVCHERVVDTSILFPHPKGHPIKYSLKVLAGQHLKKNIQGEASGHDSIEDARSSLQLVFCKIKEVQQEMLMKEFSIKKA